MSKMDKAIFSDQPWENYQQTLPIELLKSIELISMISSKVDNIIPKHGESYIQLVLKIV